MERDMSKALLSVQKWLVWDARALISPVFAGAQSPGGWRFFRGDIYKTKRSPDIEVR